MLQKIKRKCKPTILLLIVGFAISFTSVLIGISTIDALIEELSKADGETPIYWTMENTGLSLALAIYIFSVANCLVVTNYWIISQRRDMAIRKAFGWSNRQLIRMVISEMAGTLGISFILSMGLYVVLSKVASELVSTKLTPFLVLGTCVILLFTLCIAVSIPIIRILKIRPAEVVS